MNKKGFTLTELLAVIAILAVVSTIAGFSYTKVMKDNRIKQCEQKVLYIEKQAIKYASDYNLLHNVNSGKLKIDDMVCQGYLIIDRPIVCVDENGEAHDAIYSADENDTVNPITNENFCGEVSLTKINGLINAEYEDGKCEYE